MNFLILRKVHPAFLTACKEANFQATYLPELSRSEALKIVHQYEVIIGGSLNLELDRELLQEATRLKVIGRPGSGLDLIDLSYCKENGIQVFNSPEGNRNAVAEHLLGMLLTLLNQLHLANLEVKKFIWERERNRGFELQGKTVGIIGFGNNGSIFAKKLSGMDVQVLAYDRYKTNYATEMDHVKEVKLETLCQKADIISFHVQHNQETHHYLNADFIHSCSKPFIVLNASRGKVIDTKALINGLETGKISGACLDVLENENPSKYSAEELEMYQKLFNFKQVLMSPHVAGWSHWSKVGMSMILFEKIKDWIQNRHQKTDL